MNIRIEERRCHANLRSAMTIMNIDSRGTVSCTHAICTWMTVMRATDVKRVNVLVWSRAADGWSKWRDMKSLSTNCSARVSAVMYESYSVCMHVTYYYSFGLLKCRPSFIIHSNEKWCVHTQAFGRRITVKRLQRLPRLLCGRERWYFIHLSFACLHPSFFFCTYFLAQARGRVGLLRFALADGCIIWIHQM